jgi:hypothetical protein
VSSPKESNERKNRFQDKSGREWVVELDYAKLRKIRDTLDVDLGNTIGFTPIWGKLLLDDLLFQEVLWVCIDKGDGTTLDDFLSQMDGATTLVPAQEALHDALVFFTPPDRRPMLKAATETLMKGYREAMENSSQMLAEVMSGATSRARKRLGKRPTR